MSREATGDLISDLRLAGYAVLPAPREVRLEGAAVRVDASWGLKLSDVDAGDIAVRTLQSRLAEEHGFELEGEEGGGTVELSVQPGAVDTGAADGRDEQAYLMEIGADNVTLVGNGRRGLFYGVQTLLQLLEGNGIERGVLPLGRIADWPRFELRLTHWDTKHHRDTMETLKRYLDWCGRFKINGILFELEDKFEYPSHPVIGAPGAFTTAELQELTDYALERHIEIVPDVQAPAHLCYVLKHEEFAHLRCDGSNYQSCMDEPEVRKLLFDMYTDVCNATKGTQYFHVSTDEVYYAGICEKFRKPYNPENRSLTVIDYVNAAHEHLSKLGRRVIIWLEYPMLTEHITKLPKDLLSGIGFRGAEKTRVETEHGIRQFAYNPIQGGELTFPNYFPFGDAYGKRSAGRLADSLRITSETNVEGGNAIGTICTAWDDCGLHSETFWLGWASMAQGGWTQDAVSIEEMVATFVELYYGRAVVGMADVYHDLQEQARWMEHALEKLPSVVRGPSYGHPYWRGKMERYDRTMVPPAEPRMPNDTGVSMVPRFAQRYAKVLAEVPARLSQSDRLLARLQANLPRARRNRHNLEVFISLAHYLRHFIRFIQAVAQADNLLHEAALAGKGAEDKRAMHCLVSARETMQATVDDLYVMFGRLKAVWEKSRLPKNAPVDGREFVHVMDDVKDHFADRRVGLDYLIAPHESLELGKWLEKLDDVIERYGESTGQAVQKKDRVPVDEG